MKFCIQLMLPVMLLTGCVSTENLFVKNPIPGEVLAKGDIVGAEQATLKEYTPDGDEKLLYHMELGLLAHLQGQFDKSNEHLAQAESIVEERYTISVSDKFQELMSGPSFSPYKGFIFEDTFINYYKALNYLKQAKSTTGTEKADLLDAAIVEIRRMNLHLETLVNESGGYKAPEEEGDAGLFAELLGIFNAIAGDSLDKEGLEYKDDAYGHYLSGLLFEMANDLDNARIEYEKAATAYENGFAKQYGLGDQIVQQAWYDAIKVMKLDGGYKSKWTRLAKQKLTAEQKKSILEMKKASPELVVIQDLGMAPQRDSLEMMMTIDASQQAIVLSPMLAFGGRDAAKQRDQRTWFYMLYADNQVGDVVRNYVTGDAITAAMGFAQKRISLPGPIWEKAQDVGLIAAVGNGVRVSVPYYPQPKQEVAKSELYVDGKLVKNLTMAHSLEQVAVQEQMRVASDEIIAAIARETLKAMTAEKASEYGGQYGALLSMAGKALNTFTAGADTRNWSTLPSDVMFTRIPVTAGQHQVEVRTYLLNGQVLKQQTLVNADSNQPVMWHTRTLPEDMSKPALTAQATMK